MVFYAIVARLDPAQSWIQVAVILLFSVFFTAFLLKNTEKREITTAGSYFVQALDVLQ